MKRGLIKELWDMLTLNRSPSGKRQTSGRGKEISYQMKKKSYDWLLVLKMDVKVIYCNVCNIAPGLNGQNCKKLLNEMDHLDKEFYQSWRQDHLGELIKRVSTWSFSAASNVRICLFINACKLHSLRINTVILKISLIFPDGQEGRLQPIRAL